MTYHVTIVVDQNGTDWKEYVNTVEFSENPNDAIDFAEELAQRAADMRESDDWKDMEDDE